MRRTEDTLHGSLLGLLIGDAVGVPYEFNGPDQLPPFDDIEMPPPATFPRTHEQAPAGCSPKTR